MKQLLTSLFRFLPVQLFLLHFRKYQLLLVFWMILVVTITGNFAETFGAASLFLAPEYRGRISFLSMSLVGAGMAVFVMSWHITTFIIHSHRIPFMGAVRQAFLKYCINNSILPAAFLVFYSVVTIRFQWYQEHMPLKQILLLQSGFYLGLLFMIVVSFLYFFRVGRDLLKTVIDTITNPSRIRSLIPYDTLDDEYDLIRAETYLSGRLAIRRIRELEAHPPRLLATVLRRHHRNAVTAFFFAVISLALLGIFIDKPALRIPAAAGFLILFTVLTGFVGAMKYFLRSWELLGWITLFSIFSLLVHYKAFDLRSIAYGLNYRTKPHQKPAYDYTSLRNVFTPARYEHDRLLGLHRLEQWKQNQETHDQKPPLIIISVSGGGSRSAYWTFRSLQYLDSITNGKLFRQSVLITGASGGMIGATYWRSVHAAYQNRTITDPYNPKYQDNIGKDLLNAIIFSMVSSDLFTPFNKTLFSGYSYTKDRGFAFEQELIYNTEGLLDYKLGDYAGAEAAGKLPAVIINGTIVNDGRRLMVSAQPVSYLTQPAYALSGNKIPPIIDAVDFATFFRKQDPYSMRITSALRMSATFPLILPALMLPSVPQMNIMDAGLRDNFGTEVATRYLFVFKDWIKAHAGNVIYLQIRDTREAEMSRGSEQNSLISMITDPLFTVQSKWGPIQSFYSGDLRDLNTYVFEGKLKYISLEYIPEKTDRSAPLNFHLTQREKTDLYRSIYWPQNKAAIDTLLHLLQ